MGIKKKRSKQRLALKNRWALMDVKDKLWLGDDNGAIKRFPSRNLALLAARVVAVQLGWPPNRIEPRVFTIATRIRDHVPVKMTALEAIEKIEEGRAI